MSQSEATGNSHGPAKVDSQSGRPPQEEDGFIDIQDADVDMQDSESDDAQHSSGRPLELHRYGNNLEDVDDVVDDEDESDDDHNPMASHPLLSMLTGRLGPRRRGSTHKWDRLHPENQTLSVANADECSALEDQAFPPEERATREKVRLLLPRLLPKLYKVVSKARILMPGLMSALFSFTIGSLGAPN